MRKSSVLEVTYRIRVRVSSSDRLGQAVSRFDEFICRETLANQLEFSNNEELAGSTDWDINGEKAAISVERV